VGHYCTYTWSPVRFRATDVDITPVWAHRKTHAKQKCICLESGEDYGIEPSSWHGWPRRGIQKWSTERERLQPFLTDHAEVFTIRQITLTPLLKLDKYTPGANFILFYSFI